MKICRGVNIGIHPKKLPYYSEKPEDEKYWEVNP